MVKNPFLDTSSASSADGSNLFNCGTATNVEIVPSSIEDEAHHAHWAPVVAALLLSLAFPGSSCASSTSPVRATSQIARTFENPLTGGNIKQTLTGNGIPADGLDDLVFIGSISSYREKIIQTLQDHYSSTNAHLMARQLTDSLDSEIFGSNPESESTIPSRSERSYAQLEFDQAISNAYRKMREQSLNGCNMVIEEAIAAVKEAADETLSFKGIVKSGTSKVLSHYLTEAPVILLYNEWNKIKHNYHAKHRLRQLEKYKAQCKEIDLNSRNAPEEIVLTLGLKQQDTYAFLHLLGFQYDIHNAYYAGVQISQ